MNGINAINEFLLTFKDPNQEQAFLKWSFQEQFKFFKRIAIIGIIATLLFAIPDLNKNGFNRQFLFAFLSRAVLCFSVYIALILIERKNNPPFFHAVLFLIAYSIIINTTYVVIQMGNHSIVYSISEVIGIMVMYVLLPQRFLYALLSAIPASVALMLSHSIFGNMDLPSLQTMFYAFILSNAFGILYNRDRNISSRKEFLSLQYEQKLNARLEKEIRQREKVQKELLDLARTDYLTGLKNRLFFSEIAGQEILECDRYNKVFTLLMIDIDHFKKINDKHGHPAGDKVLIAAGEIFAGHIRKSDILARIGGEEFAIIAPNTNEEQGLVLAENLRKAVEKKGLSHIAPNIKITISIGLTQYNKNAGFTGLMQKADTALYEAKANGRNRVVAYSRISSQSA